MSDPILARLQALLEEARREAYERGYADAIRRVMSVAAELPQEGQAPVPRPAMPAPAAPAYDGNGAARRSRAPRGSVERRVLTLLRSAPAGLTVPEIESLASVSDEPIKGPSIRVALQRLLASGQIEREGRRWLVRSTAEGEADEAALVEGEASEALIEQAPD